MICQECQMRPATLHFTQIMNGEKTEIHVCDECAKQDKYSAFFSGKNSSFSFHNLLAGLLNHEHAIVNHHHKVADDTQQRCHHCHMTYEQFIQVGKFGCSHCYETFREQLQPILRKLHGGNNTHKGKFPERLEGNIRLKKELEQLKQLMTQHIQKEEFEKAAELRDRIREISKQLSEHREEE
ncbi:UvrB/UvrC motif-containing protein [Ectobacillus antri]|uniref:UvrB/UvrC motif-containing protein n=1 Tax=Ectobacillus antri TaxID=2486280 RepID=A0ABT6H7T0_9BACI|nr:UvrB/UvrC motif-containing protein [Ectobacillus antri]MDG4657834.1 UvrB/UvrC motif-containing protein [Ectobacillus antri]MDG5754913.1 UvrB/UvrC motif-containing protein [Ectobacillus antri]